MSHQNDPRPKDYQDELDTDPNKVDRATEEMTDNLADDAGIPAHELAHELKKITLDEEGRGDEDSLERIEDLDQDMDDNDDATTPGKPKA